MHLPIKKGALKVINKKTKKLLFNSFKLVYAFWQHYLQIKYESMWTDIAG